MWRASRQADARHVSAGPSATRPEPRSASWSPARCPGLQAFESTTPFSATSARGLLDRSDGPGVLGPRRLHLDSRSKRRRFRSRTRKAAAVAEGQVREFEAQAEEQELAALADECPYLAEVVAGNVEEVGYDFGRAFEYGLDLILEALEKRRDTPPDEGRSRGPQSWYGSETSRPAIATPSGRSVCFTRIVSPWAASTSGRRLYTSGASSAPPPTRTMPCSRRRACTAGQSTTPGFSCSSTHTFLTPASGWSGQTPPLSNTRSQSRFRHAQRRRRRIRPAACVRLITRPAPCTVE